MAIYTRNGDDGMTNLADGTRVGKHDARIATLGAIDELNAHLGLARAQAMDQGLIDGLVSVQNDLFAIGAALANPGRSGDATLDDARIGQLEAWIDRAEKRLSPLQQFILPGGCTLAAQLHVARVVCRRAERSVVHLSGFQDVWPPVLRYLNRLSDVLFTWARLANQTLAQPETPWSKPT